MQKQYLLGLMTWKVMQRNAWKDIANWQKKQLNTKTKSQLHVQTTTKSRKRIWDLLENCQKYAHKWFCNASICLVNKLARAITKWTRACEELLSF